MAVITRLPQAASYRFPWIITFLLTGLAWVVTYQQLAGMHFLPMYGTMGMPLGPFLLFWTIMMAAMMLPALAPMVSIQYDGLQRLSLSLLSRSINLLVFLLGYLFGWCCFGLPVFFLALLSNYLVRYEPWLGVALGIMLFILAGLYQMTPLQRRYLAHCNPSSCSHTCGVQNVPTRSPFSNLKTGIFHSISCLGCCGNLMIVLVAVGLMNLFWMVLITLVIFIEKVWHDSYRLNSLIGMALIFYGAFSYVEPSLLSGLYVR